MNELISVVIPVYNVDKYLERAMNCIINQTYKELEIILVNDGSSDNSGDLCDNFAKNDKRIKVIHQKNSGVAAARNAGIKSATGKYIGFVDPDDMLSERMYEFMYQAIKENNAKISVCNFTTFCKVEPKFDQNYEVEVITADEAITEIMRDKRIMSYSWNKLFDRTLFENIEFPLGKNYEDVGTIFKLFFKVDTVAYLNMNLYGYYVREDSITGNYDINAIMNFVEMITYRYEVLIKEKPALTKYINMNRVNFCTRCFLDLAKHKKIRVLKNVDLKNKLLNEIQLAKKLNTAEIEKINTKKLKFLNKILLCNYYIFYYMMRLYYLFISKHIEI